MSPIKQYRGITFPVNPLYVHTPDSIVQDSAGLVTSWNDESGNGYNASTIAAGSHRVSNQNSLLGLQPNVSSSIQKIITVDRGVFTVALLVQRNPDVKSIVSSSYLWFQTQTDLNNDQYIVGTIINQLAFGLLGSTNTTITANTYNLGQYAFIIIRGNYGDVNYYVNNVSSNVSVTKTSTPVTSSRTLYFMDSLANNASKAWCHNLSAYWTRNLSDAECLQLSNYVYMMSNGATGDAPINTALISKKQAELGAL